MNINEQQYLDDYVKLAKTLNKVWCLGEEEINEVKGCLVRVALYKEKLYSQCIDN